MAQSRGLSVSQLEKDLVKIQFYLASCTVVPEPYEVLSALLESYNLTLSLVRRLFTSPAFSTRSLCRELIATLTRESHTKLPAVINEKMLAFDKADPLFSLLVAFFYYYGDYYQPYAASNTPFYQMILSEVRAYKVLVFENRLNELFAVIHDPAGRYALEKLAATTTVVTEIETAEGKSIFLSASDKVVTRLLAMRESDNHARRQLGCMILGRVSICNVDVTLREQVKFHLAAEMVEPDLCMDAYEALQKQQIADSSLTEFMVAALLQKLNDPDNDFAEKAKNLLMQLPIVDQRLLDAIIDKAEALLRSPNHRTSQRAIQLLSSLNLTGLSAHRVKNLFEDLKARIRRALKEMQDGVDEILVSIDNLINLEKDNTAKEDDATLIIDALRNIGKVRENLNKVLNKLLRLSIYKTSQFDLVLHFLIIRKHFMTKPEIFPLFCNVISSLINHLQGQAYVYAVNVFMNTIVIHVEELQQRILGEVFRRLRFQPTTIRAEEMMIEKLIELAEQDIRSSFIRDPMYNAMSALVHLFTVIPQKFHAEIEGFLPREISICDKYLNINQRGISYHLLFLHLVTMLDLIGKKPSLAALTWKSAAGKDMGTIESYMRRVVANRQFTPTAMYLVNIFEPVAKCYIALMSIAEARDDAELKAFLVSFLFGPPIIGIECDKVAAFVNSQPGLANRVVAHWRPTLEDSLTSVVDKLSAEVLALSKSASTVSEFYANYSSVDKKAKEYSLSNLRRVLIFLYQLNVTDHSVRVGMVNFLFKVVGNLNKCFDLFTEASLQPIYELIFIQLLKQLPLQDELVSKALVDHLFKVVRGDAINAHRAIDFLSGLKQHINYQQAAYILARIEAAISASTLLHTKVRLLSLAQEYNSFLTVERQGPHYAMRELAAHATYKGQLPRDVTVLINRYVAGR